MWFTTSIAGYFIFERNTEQIFPSGDDGEWGLQHGSFEWTQCRWINHDSIKHLGRITSPTNLHIYLFIYKYALLLMRHIQLLSFFSFPGCVDTDGFRLLLVSVFVRLSSLLISREVMMWRCNLSRNKVPNFPTTPATTSEMRRKDVELSCGAALSSHIVMAGTQLKMTYNTPLIQWRRFYLKLQ